MAKMTYQIQKLPGYCPETDPEVQMDCTRLNTFFSSPAHTQVAQRGSILFFTVLSLQNLDPVYTFSSDWFMEVFRNCLQSIQPPPAAGNTGSGGNEMGSDTEADDLFKAYVNDIADHVTLTVFHRVSYGILARHFLPFSFKLCTMLLMHRDKTLGSTTALRKSEWMALLRGNLPESDLAIESQHSSKQPEATPIFKKLKPELISYEAWEGATRLDKALHGFSGLLMHMIHNVDIWVRFSKSECPWMEDFGDEEVLYQGSITKSRRRTSMSKPFVLSSINSFQRLVLITIFCPNQLAASVKWFIEREMSAVYTTRVPPDLEAIFQLTSSVNPALIIITPSE